SYHVHFKAKMNQLYNIIAGRVQGSAGGILSGSLEAGMEEAKKTGAIEFEITDYSTKADHAELEQRVMMFLQEKIINDWMRPVLTPGSLTGLPDYGYVDTMYNRQRFVGDLHSNSPHGGAWPGMDATGYS